MVGFAPDFYFFASDKEEFCEKLENISFLDAFLSDSAFLYAGKEDALSASYVDSGILSDGGTYSLVGW